MSTQANVLSHTSIVTISFAAELDSPYLREPSTAVAKITGRPAKSVRQLLVENRERLREAAAE